MIEEAITAILKREGGYVDCADDKGGPTNFGVTQTTLADWRGHPVSKEDVRALTETEARAIYRKNYITNPGFDKITDERLFNLVVDCAVNHGVERARNWYSELPRDESAYVKLLARRIRFYGQIISKNPSQSVFASGWLSRVSEFVEAA